MSTDLELCELIAARFSHDLAGPIGALNNGLDFLEESNLDMRKKAIDLISESSKEALARLKFFRQVYGTTSNTGEANLGLLKELTLDLFFHTKIKIEWEDKYAEGCEIAISSKLGKLLLNLILLCSSTLIYGGNIKIILEKVGEVKRLKVVGHAEQMKLDQDITRILNEDININDVTSRNIQIFYTKLCAESLEAKISIEKNDDNNIYFIADYIHH